MVPRTFLAGYVEQKKYTKLKTIYLKNSHLKSLKILMLFAEEKFLVEEQKMQEQLLRLIRKDVNKQMLKRMTKHQMSGTHLVQTLH